MRGQTWIAAVLLTVLRVASGEAAEAPDATRFRAFIQSNAEQPLVNHALAAVPPTVFRRCPAMVSGGSTVTIIKPVTFGTEGLPNAGEWKQSLPVSGCGSETVLNFFFRASVDEKIDTTIGPPGTTRTSLVLARDATMYAFAAAATVLKDCKSFVVKNSRFEGVGTATEPAPDAPRPGSTPLPWRETWTLAGCGHSLDMPLSFLPDATGTQIVAHPGGIVPR